MSNVQRHHMVAGMSTPDIISLFNILATVAAVIAAPVIGLRISAKLQERTDIRKDRLSLLGVLFSLRHQPLSPEVFRALNMIDVVFVDETKVREAWSKYYASLSDQDLNTSPGHSIREEKRRDLMMSIVQSLRLDDKISTSDLLRTYTPTASVENENLKLWENIKKRVDLRDEFMKRNIGFPDFKPTYYQPPRPNEPPGG